MCVADHVRSAVRCPALVTDCERLLWWISVGVSRGPVPAVPAVGPLRDGGLHCPDYPMFIRHPDMTVPAS